MEKNTRKNWSNFIFFVLLIVITFIIFFKDRSITAIFEVLKETNKAYIGIAFLCIFVYLCLEGANIKRTLRKLGNKITPLQAIKYSFIGFFFSGITPAASGGQPMQIYFMHKDGIEIAQSTITLLMNLMSMQIVTISIALISICFNFTSLDVGLRIFFVFGVLLNISALLLLLLTIFNEKVTSKIVNFSIKFLKKIKYKKVDEVQKKLEESIVRYQGFSTYIKNNKKMLFKMILITALQFLIYYSITFWIYKSLGLNDYFILKIISMQSVAYATTSGIPSPGAVGVSEAAYIGIFKTIIPENLIDSAMLLSRGINFYFPMIITGIVVLISTLMIKDRKNNHD